ncbi:synaptic vesicle glycoprotein 2C-like [Teleopsis dalmanni]|nr:synaptic vesicle glycoprotein 2C-like [Teleopsis dalmanni]
MADEPPSDFETAMKICGFGKFNIYLLLVIVIAIAATTFETSSMSYILPTAECDLRLSLLQKGILNAITYTGTILSAVPWGFIADTMGRKQVIIYGLLLDGVFTMGAALSQNITQLMIFKFLGGFAVCGPFAVIMSYVSELHGKDHRSQVMMVVGLMKGTGFLILPILAYFILPYHIAFKIWVLKFHTWQIFVATTAIPSLISAILIVFLPESPKFLMTKGKNEEALKVFQIIYAVNTGRNKSEYPIKILSNEAPFRPPRVSIDSNTKYFRRRSIEAQQNLSEGFKQLRPMFSSPYIVLAVFVYTMNFFVIMGQNTLRLWLPQIFASLTEFQVKQTTTNPSMCTILEYNVNKTELLRFDEMTECDVHISAESYTPNIIVAAVGFFGYIGVALLVPYLGTKNILSIGLGLSVLSNFGMFLSFNYLTVLLASAAFITFSSIAVTTIINVSVDVFPTTMRTMVVVLVMTFGRLGAVLGNVLFPVLISLGCLPPFLTVGGVIFVA